MWSSLQAVLPGAQRFSCEAAGKAAPPSRSPPSDGALTAARLLLLQSECHPDTCTQMTATEQWIFLCAAHKTPKEASVTPGATAPEGGAGCGMSLCVVLCPQCPAIDYTRHTLDGAACLLNSNKYFPSRSKLH